MYVPKVFNVASTRSGRPVANQYIIVTPEGTFFQSYRSVIAFIDHNDKVTLDQNKWDYSRTTAKYRNAFLNLDTKEIQKRIKSGDIELGDLN